MVGSKDVEWRWSARLTALAGTAKPENYEGLPTMVGGVASTHCEFLLPLSPP